MYCCMYVCLVLLSSNSGSVYYRNGFCLLMLDG